jgi:hypothetical protein
MTSKPIYGLVSVTVFHTAANKLNQPSSLYVNTTTGDIQWFAKRLGTILQHKDLVFSRSSSVLCFCDFCRFILSRLSTKNIHIFDLFLFYRCIIIAWHSKER